jgi:hypothetical protein
MIWLIWIPAIVAINVLAAKLTLLNQAGNNIASMALIIVSAIPLWVIVSRYSKNILFDAMLYDSFMVVTFALALTYFGHAHLSWVNYLGIALFGVAMILIKL